MIERSTYIESAGDWFKNQLATPNDRLLSAFVSLRLITSAHSEVMTSQIVRDQRQQALQFRSLLRLLDRQIDDWQKVWQRIVSGDGEHCHQFLIPFYGTYARLLLFTLPLSASLRLKDVATSVDTEAIWNSGSSALDMLKLVSDASTSQLLYFAQDSVHVMIAYATVFLVKVTGIGPQSQTVTDSRQLLVSAPTYIRSELERPAVIAIRDAAKTLTLQAAPERTGCALQAKFLYNVLREYEMFQNPPRRSEDSYNNARNCTTATAAATSSRSPPLALSDVSVQVPGLPPIYDAQDSQEPTHQMVSGSSEVVDDEMWALIFANAGFNIDDGTFTLSMLA